MVDCGYRMEGSWGQKMTSEKLNVAEALRWTLRVVNFSEKTLGS